MSADRHRSRDRRRQLIWRASHDYWGVPIPNNIPEWNGLAASKRNFKNRDVRRLLADGHLKVYRRPYRGAMGGHLSRNFLVVS